MTLWEFFYGTREVTYETQPNHEPRQRSATTAFDETLVGERTLTATLEATDLALAALYEANRREAQVFLINLPGQRIAPAVRYLESLGYRMKFRGRMTEMVRP